MGSIFSLVLIAILSGCKNPCQIEAFAKVRPKLLKKLGFRPPKYPRKRESRGKVRAPSDDTIKRVAVTGGPGRAPDPDHWADVVADLKRDG